MSNKENYPLEFLRGGNVIYNEWVYDEEMGEGEYVQRELSGLDWLHKRDRQVYFHDNVTLYDLFLFVEREPEVCDIVFVNCFIKEYVKAFIAALPKFHETKKIRQYHPDEIEYLEVYWNSDLYEYDGITSIDGLDRACCHGIGYELKEDKYEEYQLGSPAWKAGQRIHWGIDFCSLSELLNIPVRLNTEFEIYAEWDRTKEEIPLILSCQRKFSLYQAIEAVFWELSFFGSEEEKEEKKNELDGIIDDIKTNGYSVIDIKEEMNDGYINEGIGWKND